MPTENKTKVHQLKDLDFSSDTAHIALVSKQQGNGANGHHYSLLVKNSFSPETITKAQTIRVTMELPEFLEKFFYVYGSNAEILARMMGWMPEDEDENEEKDDYEDYWKMEHQAYIEEKLASFEIMKAAHEKGDVALADINDKQYIKLLRDQALVEKAFRKIDREAKKNSVADTAAKGSTEAVEKSVGKGEVDPSSKTQEKNMEENQLQELQKALDSQKEELQKALEQVAKFEAEKKEALIKSKTGQITALVQDEKTASALVKAALMLESDEDFTAFVGAVKTMAEQVEKSALFREQGVTAGEQKDNKEESRVAQLLKAQFANK